MFSLLHFDVRSSGGGRRARSAEREVRCDRDQGVRTAESWRGATVQAARQHATANQHARGTHALERLSLSLTAKAERETRHITHTTLDTETTACREQTLTDSLTLTPSLTLSINHMHTSTQRATHTCVQVHAHRYARRPSRHGTPFLNYDCWRMLATQSCIMRRHSSSCCPQSHSSLDPSKSPVRAVWRQQDGGEVCKCKLLRLRLAAPLIEGAL